MCNSVASRLGVPAFEEALEKWYMNLGEKFVTFICDSVASRLGVPAFEEALEKWYTKLELDRSAFVSFMCSSVASRLGVPAFEEALEKWYAKLDRSAFVSFMRGSVASRLGVPAFEEALEKWYAKLDRSAFVTFMCGSVASRLGVPAFEEALERWFELLRNHNDLEGSCFVSIFSRDSFVVRVANAAFEARIVVLFTEELNSVRVRPLQRGEGAAYGTVTLDVINYGLDCAVKDVNGACPDGYVATLRTCAEGYCCLIAPGGNADRIQEATGLPKALVANVGFELLFAGVTGIITSTIAKKLDANAKKKAMKLAVGETAGDAVGTAAEKVALKIGVKTTEKAAIKVAAKTTTKGTMLASKSTLGPAGWVLAAADAVNLLIDIYDPNGCNQFGSNVAFKATRDQLEYMFITKMSAVQAGPPFLYPFYDLLSEAATTADGAQSTVASAAIFTEQVNSIAWCEKNMNARYLEIVDAALAGAIEKPGMCGAQSTDACTAYTTKEACDADTSGGCVFGDDNRCVSSNFTDALLQLVPLSVRDAHFLAVVRSISPASADLIAIFDRRRHTWFVGVPEMPYAITLTEKGRDKANAARKTPDAPLAVITRDYRAAALGTWKYEDKFIDAEGVSDIPPFPGQKNLFKNILRALCEDTKSGGIEDIGPVIGDKMGVPIKPENSDPNWKRDDLDPKDFGVRYDMNRSTCIYTKEYCDRAGLGSFTNQFGALDCKLRDGQGWAEMVFGTNLTRAVVGSAESLIKVLDSLLDPKNTNSKKPGEACKVLTECLGHGNPQATRVSCCPKTLKDGIKIRDTMLIGAGVIASSVFTWGVSSIALAAVTVEQSKVPRTCQPLFWTSGSLPVSYCPFDAANPKLQGAPIADGELCAQASSCERCASGKWAQWVSKGFTPCGIEPGWTDGTVCGPGTTCKQCSNPATRWADGSYHCGEPVASGSVLVGGACIGNDYCAAHTDSTLRTMCCNKVCARAFKSADGLWWCPNTAPSSSAVGAPCTTDVVCTGRGVGCCEGKCTLKTEISPGVFVCPSQLVKDMPDGTTCNLGTTCNRCVNVATWRTAEVVAKCGRANAGNLGDGVACDLGSTCGSCKNDPTDWSMGGFRCGLEPKTTADGVECGAGSTCKTCKNTPSTWSNGSYRCGTEPRDKADGTVCAFGSECNFCRNTATMWSTGVYKCGKEPLLADGQSCVLGTSRCGTERIADGQACALRYMLLSERYHAIWGAVPQNAEPEYAATRADRATPVITPDTSFGAHDHKYWEAFFADLDECVMRTGLYVLTMRHHIPRGVLLLDRRAVRAEMVQVERMAAHDLFVLHEESDPMEPKKCSKVADYAELERAAVKMEHMLPNVAVFICMIFAIKGQRLQELMHRLWAGQQATTGVALHIQSMVAATNRSSAVVRYAAAPSFTTQLKALVATLQQAASLNEVWVIAHQAFDEAIANLRQVRNGPVPAAQVRAIGGALHDMLDAFDSDLAGAVTVPAIDFTKFAAGTLGLVLIVLGFYAYSSMRYGVELTPGAMQAQGAHNLELSQRKKLNKSKQAVARAMRKLA
ncbi:hypothetical protein T492DRAFT_858905 [Pavlovales sp. CCMP2436]|nr:hypothetical protein T492DRAFT_858905 [Pavlovales sp. CCMP2436]